MAKKKTRQIKFTKPATGKYHLAYSDGDVVEIPNASISEKAARELIDEGFAIEWDESEKTNEEK